jgi:methylenetetrahydrofolate--tRNA-(uracil-5-)-methyltransferase
VESAAIGLLSGRFAAAEIRGESAKIPPETTALGSLLGHITGGASAEVFQPMNINFGLMPPLAGRVNKKDRKLAYCQRALTNLDGWINEMAPNQEKIA